MNKYICPRCGYDTPLIGNLHMHFQRKNPCKPKIEDLPFGNLYQIYYSTIMADKKKAIETNVSITNTVTNTGTNTKKYTCKGCSKSYSHRQSLYTHRKHCKENSSVSNEITNELKNLQKQMTDLNIKIEKQEQTNIQISNCNNSYSNQIYIANNFGNENIEYINDEYVASRLKQPKQGINEIIRQIHFNPGRPENHNIKITNKKLPFVSVYKNNSWELDDKKKVINQIIYKSYGIMDCVYNDKQNTLMPSTRRQYENFQTKFDENDPKLKKDLERSTELQILNEQKVIQSS